jgi:hypothetical protein
LVTDFVEPKDAHTPVVPFDFDVAITRSVPLIDDFDDFDPARSPIKTSGRPSEIRKRLNLDAHELLHEFNDRSSPGTG